MSHFLQTPLGSHFVSFENFGQLSRSAKPTTAGLGLTLVIMVVVSLLVRRRFRGAVSALPSPAIHGWLRWTPWLALLVFMAKVGAYQNARYLAPYYPLLLLALLAGPGMAVLVRRRWWQRLAVLLMATTLAYLVFHLGRDFVPTPVFARLEASPHLRFLRALDDFYKTRVSVTGYWNFTTRHSAGEPVVGYATICGGLEPGMWRPLWHGRVERVLPDDSPAWVRSRGIRFVFIEDSALDENHETIQQWLERFHATLVDQMTFTTNPGLPPTHFYFTRLLAPGEAPAAQPAAASPPH